MSKTIECGCEKPGLKVEGFLVPCILFILRDHAAHGYEVIDNLANLPFLDFAPDGSVVYRHLRNLEQEGRLISELQPGSGGPARKVYSMTADGEEHLHQWVKKIRQRMGSLQNFLTAYEQAYPLTKGDQD